MVYREGNDGIGDGDPVPSWLWEECVYDDFCQCNLVNQQDHNWHYPGALCSNIVCRRHQLFDRKCGCSHVPWPFPRGCNRNTKDVEIAIGL